MTHLNALSNLQLARGLMADEPASFKVGYSLENAVLAVQDLRGLTDEQADELRTQLAQD